MKRLILIAVCMIPLVGCGKAELHSKIDKLQQENQNLQKTVNKLEIEMVQVKWERTEAKKAAIEARKDSLASQKEVTDLLLKQE